MKQPKSKSLVKSARKAAKSDLKERLLTTFKSILDKDKIELTKKIKKRSKKLFKAVAEELTVAKPATEKTKKAKAEKPAEVKAATPAKKATAVKAEAVVPAKAAAAEAKAAPAKTAPAKAKPEDK
jgi:hypothetical protein